MLSKLPFHLERFLLHEFARIALPDVNKMKSVYVGLGRNSTQWYQEAMRSAPSFRGFDWVSTVNKTKDRRTRAHFGSRAPSLLKLPKSSDNSRRPILSSRPASQSKIYRILPMFVDSSFGDVEQNYKRQHQSTWHWHCGSSLWHSSSLLSPSPSYEATKKKIDIFLLLRLPGSSFHIDCV